MESLRAPRPGLGYRMALPLLLAALLCLPALIPQPAQAETLRLAADSWCPFNCEAEAEKPGFLIEIARTIFGDRGIEVEYLVMPWKRAVSEARSGRVDGIVGALYSDAPGFIFPASECGFAQNGFFTLRPDWTYDGPESLQGLTFGTARGYSYGREIDELIGRGLLNADMISGNAPIVSNLQKLKAGRVDVVVAERSVLVLEAERLGLGDRIRFAGTPDTGNNVYIAFSPEGARSRQYAGMIDQGMAELRASGRLRKIMARYGLKVWR